MKANITLYTVPQGACDSRKMNWVQAGEMLRQYLIKNLGDRVNFCHTEFMSENWFNDIAAQELMEKENLNFPFVVINGELAFSGKKINISKILRLAKAAI